MYEKFFELERKPFELLPNPDFLFPSASHKRALTFLEYGIRDGSGFILLTGEVGSGKTTLIRNLLKKKPARVILSKVFNTNVDAGQLVALVNEDFGLPVTGRQKIDLLRDLNDFLIREYGAGRQAVIIVDEAQNLSTEALEEIRLISNLETDQAKLVQIILVGQPELKKTLARPELLQLRQRISINCHLKPLSQEETEQYIHFRLERAGNRQALSFSPEAIPLIHRSSRGIPRLINIICDYLMLSAFAAQSRVVDRERVEEVIVDLDFETQFWKTEQTATAKSGGNSRIRNVAELETCLNLIEQRLAALELGHASWNPDLLMDAVDRAATLEAGLEKRLCSFEQTLHGMEERFFSPAPSHASPTASGNGAGAPGHGQALVETLDPAPLEEELPPPCMPDGPDRSDGAALSPPSRNPGWLKRLFRTLNR